MNIRAKLTSKGQITLPKKMRDDLALATGDAVDFIKTQNGGYEIVKRPSDLNALRGLIKYNGPTLTTDDIVAIVRGARLGGGSEILHEIKKNRAKAIAAQISKKTA